MKMMYFIELFPFLVPFFLGRPFLVPFYRAVFKIFGWITMFSFDSVLRFFLGMLEFAVPKGVTEKN